MAVNVVMAVMSVIAVTPVGVMTAMMTVMR